jgi:8-oxo-dGTP diphosphatase
MERNVEGYVVGLLFSTSRDRVVLIRKLRPERLMGRWNGVGGKVESGEDPIHALHREFEEETGVATHHLEWHEFARLERDASVVWFFSATGDVIDSVRTERDEEVRVFRIASLPRSIVADLRWILPLARRVEEIDRLHRYTVYPPEQES